MKTLNLTKTTLVLGLLASLAVVNTSQADGPMGLNGMDLNGVRLNGMDLNGVRLNGMELNGVRLNGIDPNGVRLNGTSPTTLASNGSNGFVVRDIALPDSRKSGDRIVVCRRPGRPR